MKYILKDNKGVTLIELIMVLGIASILLAAIGSFLVTNVRYFNMANDQAEIQGHAQRLMKDFADLVIESRGIASIENNTDININLNSQGINDITKVVFYYPVGASYANSVFEHNLSPDGKEMDNQVAWDRAVTIGSQSKTVSFIKEFKLQPLPAGTSYANCKGVEIVIRAKKNQAELELENHIYFRNAN